MEATTLLAQALDKLKELTTELEFDIQHALKDEASSLIELALEKLLTK